MELLMTKKIKIPISRSEFRGRPKMARSRLQRRPWKWYLNNMVFKENNKKNKCFMLFVFIQIWGQYLTSEGILHSVPEESALLQKLQCSCSQNQNQNTCWIKCICPLNRSVLVPFNAEGMYLNKVQIHLFTFFIWI